MEQELESWLYAFILLFIMFAIYSYL